MTRLFVKQLTDGQPIDEVFLVSEKQLRPNRAGNLYLQVRLSDKTGSLTGMLWNANQRQYDSFNNGDFVRVQGTSQLFNGGMQIIAKAIEAIEKEKVDAADFVTVSEAQIDALASRLSEMLRSMTNFPLRNLAECFLVDEKLMSQFKRAPAGVKNHHAYLGGLLDHVVSLMELVAVVAPRYPQIDPDLLLMGAFLHDLGKVRELTYDPDLGYSDEGQLLGHMVIGVQLLDEKIKEAETLSGESFPEDMAMRLRHMIVSHHGQLEFGSPRVPMTIEAMALHFLDNLDAKLHNFQNLIDEDVNKDSTWTVYSKDLGRKIFKG